METTQPQRRAPGCHRLVLLPLQPHTPKECVAKVPRRFAMTSDESMTADTGYSHALIWETPMWVPHAHLFCAAGPSDKGTVLGPVSTGKLALTRQRTEPTLSKDRENPCTKEPNRSGNVTIHSPHRVCASISDARDRTRWESTIVANVNTEQTWFSTRNDLSRSLQRPKHLPTKLTDPDAEAHTKWREQLGKALADAEGD